VRTLHKERSSDVDFGQSAGPYWYAIGSQFTGDGEQKWIDLFNSHAASLPSRHYSGMMSGPNVATYANFHGIDSISYVNGQRDAFNPCSHIKSKYVCKCYGRIVRVYNRTKVYKDIPAQRSGIFGVSTGTLKNHFYNDYLAARVHAWKTMQPRIEGEMELMNFLLELGDVKSLLHHIMDVIGKLRHIGRVTHNLNRKKRFDPTLAISNLGLEYNLAITPLISDLKNMWLQLSNKIKDLQDKFINDGKKAQTRHYSEVLYENNQGSIGSGQDYDSFYGTKEKTIFYATLDFKYTYKRRSLIDFGKRYWNLNLTPEVIWNATPFSFVLDYFVKIGKAIHYMSRDKHLNMEVLEYGESVKSTRTSGLHKIPGYSKSILLIDGSPSQYGGLVSGYESTIYNRYLSTPQKIGAYAPKITKGLKNKQIFNLLALCRTAFK
jgi:hypothetical protein